MKDDLQIVLILIILDSRCMHLHVDHDEGVVVQVVLTADHEDRVQDVMFVECRYGHEMWEVGCPIVWR